MATQERDYFVTSGYLDAPYWTLCSGPSNTKGGVCVLSRSQNAVQYKHTLSLFKVEDIFICTSWIPFSVKWQYLF